MRAKDIVSVLKQVLRRRQESGKRAKEGVGYSYDSEDSGYFRLRLTPLLMAVLLSPGFQGGSRKRNMVGKTFRAIDEDSPSCWKSLTIRRTYLWGNS